MIVKIICINKDSGDHYDPHEAITILGTEGGKKYTRMEMVRFIEDGDKAYVEGPRGNVAYLMVSTSPAGNKYVKTVPDDTGANNLLELPECQ
jgi:hypothetical protein